MSYRVQLSLPAKKQLDRLDQVTAKRLNDRLKELAFAPFSTRISKAVKMEPGQRTSRVGDWRIIYRVNESDNELRVIAFRPRGKSLSIVPFTPNGPWCAANFCTPGSSASPIPAAGNE